MKTLRSTLCILVCAMFSAAFAQQSVPLAGNGPSLAVTMQFIQDKMNEQGKINYALHAHDGSNGEDWPVYQISIEMTNVIADAGTCRITWHKVTTKDGQVGINRDITLDLKAVEHVEERTSMQEAKMEDTANGHPALDKRQDPPYFVVTPRSTGNVEIPIFFKYEDTALRVAKAMTHAVELCGGGNKDKF